MSGGELIEDGERQHIGSINESAKQWLKRADKQYGRVWRRIVRASSRPKTDTDVEVDHQASERVAMAIQKIAYAHVHLQFLAARLSAESAGGGGPAIATATTSAIATSFSTSAPPSPWQSASPLPLSAHRAYVEWALVLARKLSQALARKASESDDPSDILACHLMDNPEYRLPGLDSDLIRRINKRPIHLAYFDDPDKGKWRIGAIARQLREAVDRLVEDLAHTHPDRAEGLRRQITKFESEISEAG